MESKFLQIQLRICRRAIAAGVALWMCCILASPALALPLMAVDMDARAGSGSVTAPGYQSFTLTGSFGTTPANTTRTIGSYNVTVTAVNSSGAPLGSLDDRHRTTPAGTPTLDELYRDFIFAGTTTGVGGGMNLEISGGALAPNAQYSISIYAFDSGSTAAPQPRTANWLDGNNGNVLLFSTAFSGSALPTSDGQYKYTALANTDATGKLFLEGRNTLSTGLGVFLNGFEIGAPSTLTLEINTTTGAVRFLNEQNISFDLNYYELRSAARSLDPSGWISFDKTDAGDQVGAGWDEAPSSSAMLLNEARLEGITTLAPNQWESMGAAFLPGGIQDVTFLYAGPNDGALRTGTVKYVIGAGNLYGDYNSNGVVDAADYVRWRKGGTLQNEGRTTGVTDRLDYNFWRLRFGAVSGSGNGAWAVGQAVPEPAGVFLMVFAALIFGLFERRNT